ncbi:hypothetical protein SUGI_0854180 [Cryptomeria japonica]|uniref:B3 domain-containing transcription factor NGA1-like n=1 Tax=Cryptomeria japonica TaxID=3369 RepID=UPI0024147388|nr:B3 domain-containing transcription factor NGA1-like [Cryptomeria japonica]GLJ41264.1 hypothetical protein SUGI_0854180 [Cryptomeria japonica]
MEWRSEDAKRKLSNEENGTGPENGTPSDPADSTPLFDKAVTPSDVGKLNRLVIPKHHAEKYFPMDVHSNEKGLLLNFEDTAGKTWRFRYSYWNSSQSYVLTKGWSRFVKDKKLVAGDIVSFHRGTTEAHQLYISCRHRKQPASPVTKGALGFGFGVGVGYRPFNSAASAYNPQWMHVFWPNYRPRLGPMERLVCPPANPLVGGSGPEKMPGKVEETQPKKKEVRVFGVDLAVSQSLEGPMQFPE